MGLESSYKGRWGEKTRSYCQRAAAQKGKQSLPLQKWTREKQFPSDSGTENKRKHRAKYSQLLLHQCQAQKSKSTPELQTLPSHFYLILESSQSYLLGLSRHPYSPLQEQDYVSVEGLPCVCKSSLCANLYIQHSTFLYVCARLLAPWPIEPSHHWVVDFLLPLNLHALVKKTGRGLEENGTCPKTQWGPIAELEWELTSIILIPRPVLLVSAQTTNIQ